MPSAKIWIEASATEAFGVPGIVAMELIMGCRNRPEQIRVEKYLSEFPVLWPEASDFARAFELLTPHRLAGGGGIPDCLIAAMALSRHAALCTFNRKHFQAFSGLESSEPYGRSSTPH